MADKELRKDFEIGLSESGVFFDDRDQLNGARQTHTLRAAFDLLNLDGIFCSENAPLAYFKRVKRIDPEQISDLHRKFWNHGGAPILVVLSEQEVHVYSAFVRPEATVFPDKGISALVEVLEKTSSALREFLPAVESGEYFRRNKTLFDPENRVDRQLLNNLNAARNKLAIVGSELEPKILDALLCRLVFACYLFDRKIVGAEYLRSIGPKGSSHLRDILAISSRKEAKEKLYLLFRKLGRDFNGDLFSGDLEAESKLIRSAHVGPLDDFFHGTDVQTGQRAFWPYDFSAIPVEVISSIYERFLHSAKQEGAYYTPRFLSELVLDTAFDGQKDVLEKRYLDPSCGSGVFLVSIFSRLAEEWKRVNPGARNDKRARELRKILCTSVSGIDINPTACRITAFGLYLAYLDQLSPRDIRQLKDRGHRLPRLVRYSDGVTKGKVEGSIYCGDFFQRSAKYPTQVDLVVGNPPWGSFANDGTPAADWCEENDCPIPDKQIASAFVWKAAKHLNRGGGACLVLPHGTLFNHGETAVSFQKAFLSRHSVDLVLNLTDYQFFLFAEARHPALVISYRSAKPEVATHDVSYWAPKADWLVTRADHISILPEDRSTLKLIDVINDLSGEDAPQIWKKWYWASGRDRRLLDRLSLYPRLRDHVRQTRETNSGKPWLIAEGWQPLGENDDQSKAKTLELPSKKFVEATSSSIDLFLLSEDCVELESKKFKVRRTSNPLVFLRPHVLVSQGFTRIAFSDFDVSFRHAIRGICGPEEDRNLLMFLAAYLRSPIARYFLFHTSSNWGVSRQKVHVEELLRLPLPLPDAMPDPSLAENLVAKVAEIMMGVAGRAGDFLGDRKGLIVEASNSIDNLLYEYFDVLPNEKTLMEESLSVLAPSARPTRNRKIVPTIEPSTDAQRSIYITRLCATLNDWSSKSPDEVGGTVAASEKLGFAIAVLQKIPKGDPTQEVDENFQDLLASIKRVSESVRRKTGTFELIRGAKLFDQDRLYILKPLSRRLWTETAALNDADEIAGTILMNSGVATA
ncbi:MAG: SAM-dependent methyltransferase [Pyrinomonadaceae bacterium]|nr:SAM-dependent methyltransferase [Pyrinomonadaceae bacterium]